MHRRQRKDSKKGTGQYVSKRRKDPGVPAMFPMKEQLIAKMREEREKEFSQKAARKALHAGLNATKEIEDSGDESEDQAMEDESMLTEEERLIRLAKSADTASESFIPETISTEFSDASLIIDSSRRAFYREFKEVFETADVILMVLDARDPQGCRVKEVEDSILATGGKKRLIMVLNKIDLVPRENVQGWIKVIQREFPCVAFKASTQESRSHLSSSANSTSGSEGFGAEGLMQLLKNYARSGNLSKKLRVRVGVVGYPNVGKSSIINSLKRSRVCNVGATPGVTTSRQEIHLDSTVSLIDCPGIVFNHQAEGENSTLMLRNCLKVEQLADPITPALQALARIEPSVLQRLYTLNDSEISNVNSLLPAIARRLGKLKRGGIPDLESTAKHILNDWNNGKISYFTPVPTEKPHLLTSAQFVSEFAPRFSLGDEKIVNEMEVEVEAVANTVEDESLENIAEISNSRNSNSKKHEAAESKESDEEEEYESEDEVNHQLNQKNNRNFKKNQKKLAKQARRSMQE